MKKILLSTLLTIATSLLSFGQNYVHVSYKNIQLKSFKGWETTTNDFPYLNSEGHFISLQAPAGDGAESFSLTWVPQNSRVTISDAITQNRKDLLKFIEEHGLKGYTTFSIISDTKIRGYQAKTFDIKISVEDTVIHKKVIIWEENGYQISIEKSGGMTRDKFLTYYKDIESSIVIK